MLCAKPERPFCANLCHICYFIAIYTDVKALQSHKMALQNFCSQFMRFKHFCESLMSYLYGWYNNIVTLECFPTEDNSQICALWKLPPLDNALRAAHSYLVGQQHLDTSNTPTLQHSNTATLLSGGPHGYFQTPLLICASSKHGNCCTVAWLDTVPLQAYLPQKKKYRSIL